MTMWRAPYYSNFLKVSGGPTLSQPRSWTELWTFWPQEAAAFHCMFMFIVLLPHDNSDALIGWMTSWSRPSGFGRAL
jgi:hypothetical protein